MMKLLLNTKGKKKNLIKKKRKEEFEAKLRVDEKESIVNEQIR